MTAQVTDTIQIYDKVYEICGIHGAPLFAPESLGIVPIPPHTACWRGHVDHYRLYRRKLELDQLHIWLGNSGTDPALKSASRRGPFINGVEPRVSPITADMSENFYAGLQLELPFTGGILAGRGFLRELYIHMGFLPAWKFKSIYELILDKGRLKELRDVSPEMESVRRRMLERPFPPAAGAAGERDLISWIASTFRLDYDWDSWL